MTKPRKKHSWQISLIVAMLAAICFFTIAKSAPESNVTVEIVGLEKAILDNVNIRILEKRKAYPSILTQTQIKKFYNEIFIEIRKGMEPFGYFKACATGQFVFKEDKITLHYVVIKGRPIRIASLNVSVTGPGRNNPEVMAALQSLPLHVGDVFQVPAYNDAKKNLFQAAKNQGYLKAHYNNKVLINTAQYRSDITIHLETGQQYYFGEFIFKTRPYALDFLRRFIYICRGEVFSSLRLLKLQQAMERSYYFSKVIFRPDFSNIHNRHVPVEAYLYPPKPYKYTLGLGYGTLSGVRLTGSVSLRHLNDYGHHLEADMKLSSVLAGIAVNYYIPGNNPLYEEWLMGINYKKFNPKTGKSDSITLTGGYSYKLDRVQTNANLNFLLERFYIFHRPYRYSHMFYPSWKVSYLEVDNIVSPHHAISVSLLLQGASGHVLSTTSFIQGTVKGKYIFRTFGESRAILRGDLGLTGVSHLHEFPLTLRYFAGGINSIRGFADTSIGPGKYLQVASAEYQQAIVSSWYAAIFYDVGSASNHFGHPFKRGAGIGAVYDSKIGPIKIYLAQALSKKTRPYSIEISIGPEFS